MTIDELANDYEGISQNARAVEWFVSPLEYSWPDGNEMLGKMFRIGGTPHPTFDEMISPDLFQKSMQVDFRAKMMVFAFMRQPVAKSFGLEIESGLLALYRLDFLECLSQWMYVVEGYCRKIFAVSSNSNVKSSGWTVPTTGNISRDRLIKVVATALALYLDGIMFAFANDPHLERLSRHLLLHGNVENRKFFSQKNCLILMFVLDAIVFIEMVSNNVFPMAFSPQGDEHTRIERRKVLYLKNLKHAFSDQNLLEIDLLKEHV